MYEESRQSLFLKPTVVTLVYGLSVGFFIVLTMIPSLMVIQNDMSRAINSLKRMLFGRRASAGIRVGAGLAILAIAAANAAILLPWVLTGKVLPPLAALAGDKPAVLVSLAAALVATLLIAALFVVATGMKRRHTPPVET